MPIPNGFHIHCVCVCLRASAPILFIPYFIEEENQLGIDGSGKYERDSNKSQLLLSSCAILHGAWSIVHAAWYGDWWVSCQTIHVMKFSAFNIIIIIIIVRGSAHTHTHMNVFRLHIQKICI